jgi:hypothetical protein
LIFKVVALQIELYYNIDYNTPADVWDAC